MTDELKPTCTPLYGHSNEDTAYLVADYPYGRKLRCRIRYWLESNDKGFRFVSQTENPKALTPYWNAPKKSTYREIAGRMYLDEKGHCVWEGIGVYDDAEQVLSFIERFPSADFSKLLPWVIMKTAYYRKQCASETSLISINGVAAIRNEREKEEDVAKLAKWEAALKLLRPNKGPINEAESGSV